MNAQLNKINWNPITPAGYEMMEATVLRQANEIMREYGAKPIERPKPIKAGRFNLLGVDTVSRIRPIRWRVKAVIPETGIAAIFGPSGSAKTFLSLDMALTIAKGETWFGHRTSACPVVYVCLEGEAGLSNRVTAYRKHSEIGGEVYFLTQAFNLLQPIDAPELAQAIKERNAVGGVVLIDTLNRAAPGMDENSSADMGKVIAAVKQLQGLVGGLVLLVHHTGKDASRGMRGHSSLFAALDAAIEVSRTGEQREWRIAKSKDGVDGKAHPFRLDVVELGIDEDGDQITSCAIAPLAGIDATKNIRLPRGGNQKIILDGIKELIKHSSDFGNGGCRSYLPCIDMENTIIQLRERLAVEADRKTERTRQAITGLLAQGLICTGGGWIWLK